MINVLLGASRMIVAKQKNSKKNALVKPLFALDIPLEKGDFKDIAKTVKETLKANGIKENKISLILGEDIVFKEFSHQHVNEKALKGFAKIEAKTVLRSEQSAFAVECMNYGERQNADGEETSMLFAIPVAMLKKIKTAFSNAGFTLVSVHSLFSCYSAVMKKILPITNPNMTGVAIDFGYENTLIQLYDAGTLVSQRRLPGIFTVLAPAVKKDTSCEDSEVYTKVLENKFSASYAKNAHEALVNYTYDIMRTLRVIAAPSKINPEHFFLSGDGIRDASFFKLVKENLGMPCTVVSDVESGIKHFIAHSGTDLTGLLVLAGPAYDKINLLTSIQEDKKTAVINTAVAVALTVLVAGGMMIMPIIATIEEMKAKSEETRLETLTPIQTAIDNAAKAREKYDTIDAKLEVLDAYTSKTAENLETVIEFFGEGYRIDSIKYDAETALYSVKFNSINNEFFLKMQDFLEENKDLVYYFKLEAEKITKDGTITATMYFAPKDAYLLPSFLSEEELEAQRKELLKEAEKEFESITNDTLLDIATE